MLCLDSFHLSWLDSFPSRFVQVLLSSTIVSLSFGWEPWTLSTHRTSSCFVPSLCVWTCTCSSTFHRTTCLCRWRQVLHSLHPQFFALVSAPLVVMDGRWLPPLHEQRMVSMVDPSILPSTPSKEPPWDASLALDPWDWKGDAHLPRGNPTRPRRFSNLIHDPLQSETPTDTWWTKGQEDRRGRWRIRPYVQRNPTVGTNTTKTDNDNDRKQEKQ